jgi:mono/diheme cytochrome c family protein
MRHEAVRRVSVAVAVLLLAAAALFAWLVRDDAAPAPTPDEAALPAAATDGAALYDRYCARCHEATDLAPSLRAGGAALRAEWETFLEEHGRASAAEDRAILDYLAALPER